MFPDYELTVGVGDHVVLTCSECDCDYAQLRWQFEVDLEEEGENYLPVCPSCMGLEDLP